jgi:hypothetical protein
VQIEQEPATNPEIVLSQNNGGSHVALAKTESARVSVQRLPFGLDNSVHGSSRDAHFIVTASVRIRKQAANRGELCSVFIWNDYFERLQLLRPTLDYICRRIFHRCVVDADCEMIAIFACATAKGHSVHSIPELSQKPFCGCEGDPADRPEPAGHGRNHCGQEAYVEKPLPPCWWLDDILPASQGFA